MTRSGRGWRKKSRSSGMPWEYHRTHPDKRRSDGVLETGSTADYIAPAVKHQKTLGDWASFSHCLAFQRPETRKDMSGHPFCFIKRGTDIVVVDLVSAMPGDCTLTSTQSITPGVWSRQTWSSREARLWGLRGRDTDRASPIRSFLWLCSEIALCN
jgi:hypothetical protein